MTNKQGLTKKEEDDEVVVVVVVEDGEEETNTWDDTTKTNLQKIWMTRENYDTTINQQTMKSVCS